jgi:PAS domain S-box-containing protein
VSATGDDIARIEGLVPKLYRKIFEAMPDAAVIRSLRTGCYIAANHGFEELTGYRPEDVIGRTPSEVDLWVDRAVYEAGLDVLQRSGVVHNTEARFRRRDGGITIGLVSAVRLDIDGERFIVSFVRDITERRRAERRQRLREDLVAMLSHDIRSPLMTVLNALFVLRQSDDPSKTRRACELIEVGARNALSLAQNFVDAARIEGGALEVERVPASMNEVVTRVVADQEVTARTRAVEIRASLAEDAPPVAFDVPLIERVLANLISNAVKYSPEGQAVTVTTAAGPGVVRVSVADRGPGIPANRRASLFTRYGLGEARTSDSTGLGLFVVHTFVSAHGGRVSLECPDSGGSVFTVELPA